MCDNTLSLTPKITSFTISVKKAYHSMWLVPKSILLTSVHICSHQYLIHNWISINTTWVEEWAVFARTNILCLDCGCSFCHLSFKCQNKRHGIQMPTEKSCKKSLISKPAPKKELLEMKKIKCSMPKTRGMVKNS